MIVSWSSVNSANSIVNTSPNPEFGNPVVSGTTCGFNVIFISDLLFMAPIKFIQVYISDVLRTDVYTSVSVLHIGHKKNPLISHCRAVLINNVDVLSKLYGNNAICKLPTVFDIWLYQSVAYWLPATLVTTLELIKINCYFTKWQNVCEQSPNADILTDF